MTDGLAARGARVLLIGTGTFRQGSELTQLDSVNTTLSDLRRALHDACGRAADSVTRVPADADATAVVAAVEAAAHDATGPLVLYYVGHGLLGPGDELYLATHFSLSDHSIAGAVPYRTVRDLLGGAAHGSLVVLDCCFSGIAKRPKGGGTPDPFVSAQPRGSFLLTSASHYALSFAPKGEEHTLFSGRLLRLLDEGDPTGPLWLTADRLHAALERQFADDTRVRPSRQSEGTLGALPLVRNRAYQVPDEGHVEPPADLPCPYPGLEPFRTEDSGHYFGRDDLVRRLLTAVRGNGPVVVVGASGAGKSSLLRAGLLAGLARGHASDDDATPWPALLLPAPGSHPLAALADAWARTTGRPVPEVRRALERGRFLPPLAGRAACRLLVVDQFEEVFTHCADAAERAAFIAAVAGDGPAPRPRVVLGLRADHYGSCLAHSALERALRSGQLNVPPMSEEELRAAIEGPAAAAGLKLEDGLADRLLQDLNEGRLGDHGTGALPFLAHALRETWLRRAGARLTLAGYHATGGIWRSMSRTGENLYGELSPENQLVLRELLLRMVHLPPDGAGAVIRHPIPLASLLDGLPAGAQDVRDRLAKDRLITVDQDTAQIAHESLLRAWSRLRDWVTEDAAALLQRQRLRIATEEWQAAGRDPAFLLHGSRLQNALDLRVPGHRAPLTEPQRRFLAESEAAALSTRQRERRRLRALKAAVVTLVIAVLASIGFAATALRQERRAEEQRNTAQSQRELATYRALLAEADSLRDTDPRSSLALGLAAHALRPGADARRSMFRTLAESPFRGSALLPTEATEAVLGPDGRTLAAFEDDSLTLWDVARGSSRTTALARLDCDAYTVSFGGPGGRTLAALCSDDTVSLWDLTGLHEGKAPRRTVSGPLPTGLPGYAEAMALSPDGRRAAVVGWWDEDDDRAAEHGGALALWDVSGAREPRRVSVTRGVYETDGVAFAPDGRTLAVSSDFPRSRGSLDIGRNYTVDGVRVWDVTDPRAPRPGGFVRGSDGELAFSPDGRHLATTDEASAKLLDVSDPRDPRTVAKWQAHSYEVQGFAFSPDGSRLATAGKDGVVAVWDLSDTRKPVRRENLVGHTSVLARIEKGVDIGAVAFLPDGRGLVSVNTFGRESEAVHWNLGNTQRARVVRKLDSGTGHTVVALSRDGRMLAVTGSDTVRLWDVGDPTAPKALSTARGPRSIVRDIALSGDGTLLAGLHVDGTVTLWDLTDRNRPRVIGPLGTAPKDARELLFAPDRPLLAVRGEALDLWDVADPRRPRKEDSLTDVSSLTGNDFSPDGRYLLTSRGRYAGGVHLWNRESSGASFTELVPDGELPNLRGRTAFSPDGRTVAVAGEGTSGEDRRSAVLSLFDVSDPRRPRQTGTVPREDDREVTFDSADFHPGGDLVAAGGWDGLAWLWSVGDRDAPHLAGRLGPHAGGVSDVVFSPDGRTLVAAGGGTVLFWDLGDYPAIAADTTGLACRVTGGGLEDWQWHVYAPDVPYHRSCPSR
ncbi:caspase, EACC1-associated type [Streptomyces kurssanovii]|uniref:Caspase family protein n=1 Tax=Streptomyces kurssanovii TaxID=67312 RepID=A0ABV3HQ95_9ACTN